MLAGRRYKLLDLEPLAIVALDGWNDLYDPYWWTIFGDGTPHPGSNVNFNAMERRVIRYAEIENDPTTALAEMVRSVARHNMLLSLGARLVPPRAPRPPFPNFGNKWHVPALDSYFANLAKLTDVARVRGCGFLVVVQPELGQLLSQDRPTGRDLLTGDAHWSHFPEYFGRFRKGAVERLAANGVVVLDGSVLLADARPRAELFSDDPVHLSGRGHAALAERLVAHVRSAAARGARASPSRDEP